MTTPTETPRTDAFIIDQHELHPRWDWQDHAALYADFARQLERELAAANSRQAALIAKLEQAKGENDRQYALLTSAQNKLAAERAKVRRLREALAPHIGDLAQCSKVLRNSAFGNAFVRTVAQFDKAVDELRQALADTEEKA